MLCIQTTLRSIGLENISITQPTQLIFQAVITTHIENVATSFNFFLLFFVLEHCCVLHSKSSLIFTLHLFKSIFYPFILGSGLSFNTSNYFISLGLVSIIHLERAVKFLSILVLLCYLTPVPLVCSHMLSLNLLITPSPCFEFLIEW